MNRTVLFVLSHNYSGSTWLSLMLGSHSSAFYLGEVNKCYSRKHHRGCSRCEAESRVCPYFSDLEQVPRADLFTTLFNRTQASVLVDNSKRVKWCNHFAGDRRFLRKYIHLIRDPRGIYYSIQLRGRTPELADWAERNREIHDYLTAGGLDYRIVTYNALAERTDETLAAICDWLGCNYEPALKDYWLVEHHGPGANGAAASFLESAQPSEAGFYAERRQMNFNDLRWMDHLDPAQLHSIETDRAVQELLDRLGLQFAPAGLAAARRPLAGDLSHPQRGEGSP